MGNRETVQRVPWTCQSGRFGEPMRATAVSRGYVFWTCGHPDNPGQPLDRDSCLTCKRWACKCPIGQAGVHSGR
jgi:hypothetical protein